MAPRIEEQLLVSSSTPTATPPSSPLLPSRIVSVLVGNDQGGLLAVPPFSLSKDENTLLSIQEKLSWTLHAASLQHRQLLDTIKTQQQEQGASSPTRATALLDACLFSLQGTAVMLMEHASRLVETMDATTPIAMTMLSRSKSSSSSLSSQSTSTTTNMSMGRIRASLAVRWALQYLDSVRNAWEQLQQQQQATTFNLNVKLQRLLDQMVVVVNDNNNHHTPPSRRPFRISPWILSPSQLAFDLIVGETATWSDHQTNIMTLSVDPMWQVKAEDLQGNGDDDQNDNNNNTTRPSITSCSLNILKVTHRGNGEALVKVGIAPLLLPTLTVDHDNTIQQQHSDAAKTTTTKKEKVVWGQGNNKTLALRKKFRVQEARVVQLNADPPTPKVNVDLYESSMYGDTDTTVTLLVKTYPARHQETPNLHLELILAFE